MTFELGLEEYKRFFGKKRDKFWSVHRTFVIFYCISGGIWAAVFAYHVVPLYSEYVYAVSAGSFLAISCLLYGFYRLIFWKRELEVEQQLEELFEDLKRKKEKRHQFPR